MWRSFKFLNDRHINAAQQLLKEQFPNIDGLQDSLLSQLSFNPSVNEGIQIHHIGQYHWVTSTSMGGSLSVYNSLYSSLTKSIEVQLAQCYSGLINEKKILNVDVPSAQVQTGTVDCGIIAIDFARDLAYGNDPSNISYKQEEMRQHLLRCFEK